MRCNLLLCGQVPSLMESNSFLQYPSNTHLSPCGQVTLCAYTLLDDMRKKQSIQRVSLKFILHLTIERQRPIH